MMLGFLLARAGVAVVVAEKHVDFLRDFRGDTVHPSTLEMMRELGLLDEFLKLPHSVVKQIALQIGEDRVVVGHFDHLPVRCKFIALMPQWDFLNFLADHGKSYRTFDLRMQSEAVALIEENGRVVGVQTKTPDGELQVRADLIVGCDGRHSTVRAEAGLKSDDYGAPMDVMWFRMSRKPGDSEETFGHIEDGRMMVMLNRKDYWQCAYVIPKGSADAVKRAGLDKFRKVVGDMSPFVQDAVAAANILAQPLRRGSVSIETLEEVQRRREFPTRFTQRLQIVLQNNIIGPALEGRRPKAPFFMKMLQWPLLRRIPGRLLALGIRPEHIRTPEIEPPMRNAPA